MLTVTLFAHSGDRCQMFQQETPYFLYGQWFTLTRMLTQDNYLRCHSLKIGACILDNAVIPLIIIAFVLSGNDGIGRSLRAMSTGLMEDILATLVGIFPYLLLGSRTVLLDRSSGEPWTKGGAGCSKESIRRSR